MGDDAFKKILDGYADDNQGWLAEATAIHAWRHDRQNRISLCPVCDRNDHRARIRTWRVTADEGRCAWGHVVAGIDLYRHNNR